MTRKNRIKRRKILSKSKTIYIKKSMIQKHRKTLKGGAPMLIRNITAGFTEKLITMFQFGFLSIITAPFYLIALLANLPLNTPNNISGKRLNEVKSGIIHNQLYKYLFYGYNSKDLKQEDYTFPPGSRYNLQNNKVFVECDDCKNKNPDLKGGGIPDIKGSAKKMIGVGTITSLLGLLNEKEKMQSILTDFFDYLNNLQMKDTERRDLIHKLIRSIKNKDAIIKCIIVFNTLFNDYECDNMKNEIDNMANKPGSTYMVNPTIARVNNPFMVPGENGVFGRDLNKAIKCIKGHLMYKEFGPETLTEDCLPKCPKCTFRNSVSRILTTYTSSMRQIMKGTNKDLDLLSEIFYTIFSKNYLYPGDTREKKLGKIKSSFINSLNNLPDRDEFYRWAVNPKDADMNKIKNIVINSKFIINEKGENYSLLNGIQIDNDKKKETLNNIFGDDVFNKFKKLLCRYNIIDELKKQYISLSFDYYYLLTENVIKNPKEDIHKKSYISWCNDFLFDLYKIHGIDITEIEPSYLFGPNEIEELIIKSTKPIINGIKQKVYKK